ncbi:hypothetical protein BDZ91DRAFT_720281 [Kalaharituber pfeilii]|nr:hypothetical protein BDZ91DRAFT_720281 [Kalaharituber pfeilii]
MSSQGSPSRPHAKRMEPQGYDGMNTLLQAAMASSSSTSESYPEQEDEVREGSSRTRESSTSSTSPSRRPYSGPRPPRPTYTQEQEDAIRFHRDDLSMTWTQVEEAYNSLCYADGTPWERRTISGLQSRYYRLLPMPVNESKKQCKPRPELGILIMAPERRYWWMSTSQMTPEERRESSQYNAEDSQGEDYGDDEDEEDMGENEDAKSHDSRHSSY